MENRLCIVLNIEMIGIIKQNHAMMLEDFHVTTAKRVLNLAHLENHSGSSLRGDKKRVLITSGGTKIPIDNVRSIYLYRLEPTK